MSAVPWRDRAGTFSLLKATALVAICMPAVWIAAQALTGGLGPRPVTAAIHQSGDWSVRLLALTLLVTPLRRIADWPRLIMVRRIMGLSAASYAILHVALYCVDQKFDLAKVVSEIALRFYLTIGFAALALLLTLASTSTDGMIRRLGSERWNRLHRLVYPATGLALAHFFIQSRLDVTQPVLMTGLALLLMWHRIMLKRGWPHSPSALVALACAGALATALVEFAWYGLATGANPWRVLAAHLDFDFAIRPAWWVLAAGLAAAGVAAIRQKPPRARPA